MLIIVSSAQVLIHTQNTLAYTRAESNYFYYWFLDPEGPYNEKAFPRFIDVFEIDELNSTVRSHIEVLLCHLTIRTTTMLDTVPSKSLIMS